ncbi:putative late blight resistance proteinR1B-16 [Sesamum alatum]|uniref:Late blight resistance proteinR1B-16 n=1 Tax=Sesamum alatum TaxID=300844 RepID=A0AAE1YCG1_9LAMI|nr:putative late blight resistance proteinR1B-16 [Sesamum alatum]
MGAFPENSEIHVSRLIKLWVAEGFFKPISGKSLEEAAEMYLKDLVDRNLIFVHQQESKGDVKSCGIHDLMRELCVRKAHESGDIIVSSDFCTQIAEGIGHIGNKVPSVLKGNATTGQLTLQSLSTIAISQLTVRVLRTIPNLRKLGIFCDKEVDHLTLRDCGILDPDMNRIGSLPNLEILKLQGCKFESRKWEADEGDFCQLQFLLMEKLNLVNWAADGTNFPRLEHLVIRHCSGLKEIPLAMAEVPTLKVIEVHECSPSVVDSTRMIQEEQLELGNEELEVRFEVAGEEEKSGDMAYNLESLEQIIEQFLQPDHGQPLWILDPDKKPQIESLLQKVCFFKDLLENPYSVVTSARLRNLESRIRDIAYNAEDVLESHLVDQLLSSTQGEGFIFSPPDLEKVIQDFDSANEEMMSTMEESQMHLTYRLMGQQSELEVIPIVGMGGIGKTTLARNLYKDRLVCFHFGVRAWATISQDYNVQKILLGLLHLATRGPINQMLEMGIGELGERLYKTLVGRRYLIVLDDIWDVKFWKDIRRFFPDNNNGSRIIITTRNSMVANYIGSGSSHHEMSRLKVDESWNLIHRNVFAPGETCSRGLESVGIKIAENCRGLPLTINVIGGILSQAERTQVFWDQVAEDVSTIIADTDEQFFNMMLSLSYKYLPYHLKPCLLYMGAFPEDSEIHVSRLIKLWVAEGFLKPISGKSLEEAAEIYLKALVDRNLIFVHQQEPKGDVKSCSIHDLMRDLCVRKAHEENFLFVKRRYIPGDIRLRRVCAHSIQDIDRSLKQMPLARSFLFTGAGSREILSSPLISALKLVRVLDILEIRFRQFPKEILQLVNLRYLALSTSKLPSSISGLWNLQILIVQAIASSSGPHVVMPELLDMTQLRHIKFKGMYVWIDDKYRKHFDFVVQDQLQSLYTIAISQLTDRVLRTIPNLRKLGIFCDKEVDHVRDLSYLHKLHTLKYTSSVLCGGNLLSNLIFPPSLKKLTLRDCGILSPDMNRIGSLPNLEILKLQGCKFESRKWEADEGEFCQLQFLLMEKLNLVNWAADDTNFPRLEHLVIRHCSGLEEIPLAMAEVPTLKVIEVHECSPSVVDSARMIRKNNLNLGMKNLKFVLAFR